MKSEKIAFDSLMNTRDMGGLLTKDGKRIKYNKLIRSGHLFNTSDNDKKKLQSLIDTAVDFRTDAEVYEKPDPNIEGIKVINIEIMGNKSTGISREKGFEDSLVYLMSDPKITYPFMQDLYRGFFSKSCLKGYKKFFKILLDEHKKGILFHCTAGKDRTGFAAILIELALGVSNEDILEDYMYTAVCAKDETERLTNYFIKKIGKDTPEIRKAVGIAFSPQKEYLDVLHEEFKKKYDSLDNFFSKELGLNKKKLEKLRELYLE